MLGWCDILCFVLIAGCGGGVVWLLLLYGDSLVDDFLKFGCAGGVGTNHQNDSKQ